MIVTTFSVQQFLVFVLQCASGIMFAFHFVQNYGIFNHCYKNARYTCQSPYFDHSDTSILGSRMLDSSISVHHDQIQCYQKTHASRDLKLSIVVRAGKKSTLMSINDPLYVSKFSKKNRGHGHLAGTSNQREP